jgi:AraC-like DNA-binding protein
MSNNGVDFHGDFHGEVPGDVLSDVLRFMGLEGRVFCRATLSSHWALDIPADGLVHFHYLERGQCRLLRPGAGGERSVSTGEIVLLTRGGGYLLRDAAGCAPVSIGALVGKSPRGAACALVTHGGGGDETRMLCGSFRFQKGREALLLPQLPEVMVLAALDEGDGNPLEPILRLVAGEARRQADGAGLVVSRLVEVLFVQVLRTWLESRSLAAEAGWLRALKDARIAAALGALHAQPGHAWTVARLAGAARMSRSPFAARFREAVGEAPLAYLTRWRMHLASGLLEEGDLGLKEVADRVGYRSEAGFSKAFRSYAGIPPGRWRERRATGQACFLER